MPTRRAFLRTALAGAVSGLALAPARAEGLFREAGLRGSIDAGLPVEPGGRPEGQVRRFLRVLADAAARGKPVFLPPGTYRLSGIELPDNTDLVGVPGRTRIEYTGDGRLFHAAGARRIRLSGIEIDGMNRWLQEDVGGLLHFSAVERVEMEDCALFGSARNGLHLEGSGGEIRACHISGAAEAGLYAVESRGLAIRDNRVEGCGNGGILVHRYQPGEDGTLISGNRVSRILARSGGTGQYGNGINLFRAGNVTISDNHVEDCAFSAIRANSASGVSITGNRCLRSGETAIYSEFAFEGAVISANTVHGAANGISVVNFNEGGRLASITGNVVRDITARGPYPATDGGFGTAISAEADSVLSGNAVDGAAKWGLLLGWGPYLRNVVASGNMVRNAPVGCAVSVAEGAGGALVTGNGFSDTPVAIAGFRWNEQASGDLIAGGAEAFANLTVERNRIS
ncbi:TIGR03808 family TAT-translocated repetitive protein [Gellertiella hungarica]|uniref:Putative secreted repeat protein (TIGR03808 family) n=1 Tax=Gellertiella hungarica TaxID=1572859 RepID=A0A7W6J5W3_9HYPH|nr:TIGR03808 family TAT-translocated repetitive protein [Gellertiella hungarica]MBB4064518.1 putative secreted repeat protein (TIGR03808 family) [Gellertiella hungarica]